VGGRKHPPEAFGEEKGKGSPFQEERKETVIIVVMERGGGKGRSSRVRDNVKKEEGKRESIPRES